MQPSQDRRPPVRGRLPRRVTDRVEDAAAWLLAIAALFGLLLAAWGAVRVYEEAVDQSRIAYRDRVEVEVEVLDDAPVRYREPDSDTVALRSVRFTDSIGREHVTSMPVAGESPTGTVVRRWVDRAGRIVPAPMTGLDAIVLGAFAGVGSAAAGAVGLAVAWAAVRRVLDARNDAAWEREWAGIEPTWSGRGHRP